MAFQISPSQLDTIFESCSLGIDKIKQGLVSKQIYKAQLDEVSGSKIKALLFSENASLNFLFIKTNFYLEERLATTVKGLVTVEQSSPSRGDWLGRLHMVTSIIGQPCVLLGLLWHIHHLVEEHPGAPSSNGKKYFSYSRYHLFEYKTGLSKGKGKKSVKVLFTCEMLLPIIKENEASSSCVETMAMNAYKEQLVSVVGKTGGFIVLSEGFSHSVLRDSLRDKCSKDLKGPCASLPCRRVAGPRSTHNFVTVFDQGSAIFCRAQQVTFFKIWDPGGTESSSQHLEDKVVVRGESIDRNRAPTEGAN